MIRRLGYPAAMAWHVLPADGAWKQVTLATMAALGYRLWIRCNHCGHSVTPEVEDFAGRYRLDKQTPLMIVGRALKCTKCGERKAHCWPEPYRGQASK